MDNNLIDIRQPEPQPNSEQMLGLNSSSHTCTKPNVVCSAFSFVKLLFKKYRLLSKYKPNEKSLQDKIHLYRIFKDDLDSLCFFSHHYGCEARCYRRIKNLK